MLVQIDFILTAAPFRLVKSWCDFALPVGLDHRCVHCILERASCSPRPVPRNHRFKNWKPKRDQNKLPSSYQAFISQELLRIGTPIWHKLEDILLNAARVFGEPRPMNIHFSPSTQLRTLRCDRRRAIMPEQRKHLSWQIRKLHRSELKNWRATRPAMYCRTVHVGRTYGGNCPHFSPGTWFNNHSLTNLLISLNWFWLAPSTKQHCQNVWVKWNLH